MTVVIAKTKNIVMRVDLSHISDQLLLLLLLLCIIISINIVMLLTFYSCLHYNTVFNVTGKKEVSSLINASFFRQSPAPDDRRPPELVSVCVNSTCSQLRG